MLTNPCRQAKPTRCGRAVQDNEKTNTEFETNARARQAAAQKTGRLRALRLAKDAVDKDAANYDAAAAKARRFMPRRRGPRPQASSPIKTRLKGPADAKEQAVHGRATGRELRALPSSLASTLIASCSASICTGQRSCSDLEPRDRTCVSDPPTTGAWVRSLSPAFI
jgi:hypothetical protein